MCPGGEQTDHHNQQAGMLTPQQVSFFWDFGYLRIRQVLSPDEIEQVSDAFEQVVSSADELPEDNVKHIENSPLHIDDGPDSRKYRLLIAPFVEQTEALEWLPEDPRIVEIVRRLVGDGVQYFMSDGSLFNCGTSWHPDLNSGHEDKILVKMCLYLDPMRGDNGAIRMIPGTHHCDSEFRSRLQKNFNHLKQRSEEVYGIPPEEIPSVILDTNPGDVLIWSNRTIHGSFYGGERRRQLSLNFWKQVE